MQLPARAQRSPRGVAPAPVEIPRPDEAPEQRELRGERRVRARAVERPDQSVARTHLDDHGTGVVRISPMARLLSVNVGGPREVAWEGKTVRTAIWKEAVDGPRMVRRINIDGDDQADRLAHGGEHRAVFVYQLDSYRYWERELGRDDFTLRAVRRELHRRGPRRRRGVHRRPLPDRRGAVRGHPAARHVLPRRDPHGRAARCRRCSSPTTARASTCACSRRGRCEAGDEIVKVADGPERLTVARRRRAAVPARTSRARCSSARCACRRSARAGRAASASCSPRGRGAAAPAWAGFRPLRVAEVRARARRSSRSGSCRPTTTPRRPRRRPGSTSPCACDRTPTRRR